MLKLLMLYLIRVSMHRVSELRGIKPKTLLLMQHPIILVLRRTCTLLTKISNRTVRGSSTIKIKRAHRN
jgi:hypothetical protein